MANKNKIKDICFCIIPALVGLTIIIFSLAAVFSDDPGVYKNSGWVFFWIFLGIVLISHTTISVINYCKCDL